MVVHYQNEHRILVLSHSFLSFLLLLMLFLASSFSKLSKPARKETVLKIPTKKQTRYFKPPSQHRDCCRV